LEPLTTDSDEPFTEITALVGGGAGGAGGIFGALPPPDDVPPEGDGDEDAPPAPGPLVWKGSLLSKSENDWSWPVPAGACTAETSGDVEAAGAVAVGAIEPRLGAAGRAVPVGAGAGVDAAVVVAFGSAACGADEGLPLIPIIVCAANATAPARTTPRTITVFFCFAAFSLAVSLGLFRATSRSFLAD
jgi:hypothetical protein